MIKFEFNGKPFDPRNFEEIMLKAVMEAVAEKLRQRIGAIRHPETGEFPTIVVSGTSLHDLSLRVEGSPELLALVNKRLRNINGEDEQDNVDQSGASGIIAVTEGAMITNPKVFLSYAWEDRNLAEKIAKGLMAKGIDTWWAGWCIGAGDSLRQKIDEGLSDCTHFLVLLTPNSVTKPWVNQEIDAGLTRKILRQAKFIPIRHALAIEALPPLLSGMLSPEIKDFEADLLQLVNDIYGVTRKPAIGEPPPAVVSASRQETGYSAAASAIARIFVEGSPNALFGDLQLTIDDLQTRTGLSEEDVEDALYELSDFVNVKFSRALAKEKLYVEFDKYWQSWDPARDALRLAADLVNDPQFPHGTKEIADRYGWPPRRINPAIAYLLGRSLIRNSRVLGSSPWITVWVDKTDDTRRFVRNRL
jgi:hypothetical protein